MTDTHDYEQTKSFWNTRFKAIPVHRFTSERYGNKLLDDALDWLIENADRILDFGCAPGTLLGLCAMRKKADYHGIDISSAGIKKATLTFQENKLETGTFSCGGVKRLHEYKAGSFDGIILSNVIDNLTLTDCAEVLKATKRLLKPGGKVLLKLNDYRDAHALKAYGTKSIAGDLHEETSGLYLINRTTATWETILKNDFEIVKAEPITFEPHGITNRLFLLKRR